MRRVPPEVWSALIMVILCIGVSVPALLGAQTSDLGRPLWTVLFLALLAAMLGTLLFGDILQRRRLAAAVHLVGVALSWVLVMTLPGSGLFPVVLVLMASLGVGVLPLPAIFAVSALNTGVIVLTHRRWQDDPAELWVFGGFYLLVHVAAVLSVSALLREQRLRAELGEAHVELQAASVLAEESARSAERLRIARELHDLIGHQLTVLTLELEAARHRSEPHRLAHIDRADAVARSLLQDVRGTVSELRDAPPGELQAALDAVGRGVPGVEVTVTVDDDVSADEEQSAALVRALQEIVTNALRHSSAAEVRASVRRDGARVLFDAGDDGAGAASFDEGNGLRGISERFGQLGGEARFDGSDGFRVTAWMPAR
ncbi:sensor histidine kinase [Microbacterium sp. gxy059]|uniref:sensor histidine kinase n=1 Tax=Microbacterium sp. gxy059 TaxID=2957199 RepID=UPI003D96026F